MEMGVRTTPTGVCGQAGSARPPPLAPVRARCWRRKPRSAPREFKLGARLVMYIRNYIMHIGERYLRDMYHCWSTECTHDNTLPRKSHSNSRVRCKGFANTKGMAINPLLLQSQGFTWIRYARKLKLRYTVCRTLAESSPPRWLCPLERQDRCSVSKGMHGSVNGEKTKASSVE